MFLSRLCLRQFKYLGKRRLANGYGNSAKASTLPPRVAPPSFIKSFNFEQETCRLQYCALLQNDESSSCYAGSSADGDNICRALMESNLATEVGLIVLDAVGLFCVHFKDALLVLDGDNALMRKVLDIYLSFLQIGQSESLSKHVFAALRSFINNFPVALFQGKLT